MTATAAQCPLYPLDQFPLPQIASNRGGIVAGLARTDEQTGLPQQSRPMGTGPTTIALSFRMTKPVFQDWYRWVATFGMTRYCLLPCIDQHPLYGITESYDFAIAKFNGQMRMREINTDLVEVECSVHLLPMDSTEGIPGANARGAGAIGSLLDDNPYPPQYACDSVQQWYASNGYSYVDLSTGTQIGWAFPLTSAEGSPYIAIQSTASGDQESGFGVGTFSAEVIPADDFDRPSYLVFDSCDPNQERLYLRQYSGNPVAGIINVYLTDAVPKVGDAGVSAIIGKTELVSGTINMGLAIRTRHYARRVRPDTSVLFDAFNTAVIINHVDASGPNPAGINITVDAPGPSYTWDGTTLTVGNPSSADYTEFMPYDEIFQDGVWAPFSVNVVLSITERFVTNTGTIRINYGGTCGVFIGIGEKTIVYSQPVYLYGLIAGQSGDIDPQQFIDPRAYGQAAAGAIYMFNSNYALGSIGGSVSDEAEFLEFKLAYENNRI